MKELERITHLKTELDSIRPISPEQEMKIMQKFRLDWNYHSNHIEGNSLTFGETRMLLLRGVTAQGKPLKDHFEITGHDEAIKWVEEIVKGDFPLTENFIRQLHLLILKEPYEIKAITAAGEPTKKLVEVGKYKSTPNHVLTTTGEIFYFATPEETPAKMNDLLKWYHSMLPDTNPVIMAAAFHYRFVCIHPFDDGNGRLARILMNFILMKNGFPPVIIKSEDKENYRFALRQADNGSLEKFIEYIAKNLEHSLNLMIAGARGEEIEEANDLDKKLTLLKQKLTPKEEKTDVTRTKESILKIYDDSVKRLHDKFVVSCEKFREFYVETDFRVTSPHPVSKDNYLEIRKKITDQTEFLNIIFSYESLRKNSHRNFNFVSALDIDFSLTYYSVTAHRFGSDAIISEYDQQLTDQQIDALIKPIEEAHYRALEQKLRQ